MSDASKLPYEEVEELIVSAKNAVELLDGTDSDYFELKDLVELVKMSKRLIKSCEGHIEMLESEK